MVFESGKAGIARCPFPECNARIISLSADTSGHSMAIENAPQMLAKGTQFVAIGDVWDFDNIGVSRPSQELQDQAKNGPLQSVERLLVCSECDRGPLGFAGFDHESDRSVQSLKYYLSMDSVSFEQV